MTIVVRDLAADDDVDVSLNPPGQYATDAKLRARQRLWDAQQPAFDLVGWALDVAGLRGGTSACVLDIGCGNGAYLDELYRRGVQAVGGDLSFGMLAAADTGHLVVNADAVALPFADGRFHVVLAPHMLYHVEDRASAIGELRRVLRPGGRCLAITNGPDHLLELRTAIETAARVETPGWEMGTSAMHTFALDNGEGQLRTAFDRVECVRPKGLAPARIADAAIVADYVASIDDHYARDTTRPWPQVVADVRTIVEEHIARDGAFTITGDPGAFVCS